MTKREPFNFDKTIIYKPDQPTALQPWQQPPQQDVVPVAWGYRETPVGKTGTLESDVYVPTLQAMFVGLAWGLVVIIAVALLAAWLCLAWWFAPLAGAATWAGVMAYHLTAGVQLRQSLLWKREELERRDLDGDGVVGEPKPVTLQLELIQPANKKTLFIDLGIAPEKAILFAKAVLSGASGLSVSEWTGRGGLFSRSEFERLRSRLIEIGLVRWVNDRSKQQGVTLLPAGRAVFRRLANYSPTERD